MSPLISLHLKSYCSPCNEKKYLLELEMNGQVGTTGVLGREDGRCGMEEGGEEGHLGNRGLLEVKNSWTLWCWRTWQGRPVKHLGEERETGAKGNGELNLRTQNSTTHDDEHKSIF